ncbi:DUF2752 domain-containing protein [Labilibaculum sp.]|uniref:DUF2752 domain-containing protein n=1 Tax=Labilibaculum sp. TaxID=2060723 RepID=UPI00356B0865
MSNSHLQLKQNYKIINLSLAGIILCIFIYSGLFSPQKSNHPIPSIYTKITGEKSPSTGLSRSFSALIRGDIQEAKNYNSEALPIFLFFFFQLIFRSLSSVLIKNNFSALKIYILTDITLSALTFYLTFRPLILFTIKLFSETIVNYE